MDYTESFLAKRKTDAETLLHTLEQCKYAGSMDGKVSVDTIIQTIGSYVLITDELKKEVNNLATMVKTIAEQKDTTMKVEIQS